LASGSELRRQVEEEVPVEVAFSQSQVTEPRSTQNQIKRSFFEKYVEKIKEFLDNAE
jgi:cell division protein FtsA